MLNRKYSCAIALAVLTLFASTLITGCGMGTPAAPSANGISGRAMGGNFPVVGANVYLFAASTGGYGTASTSLLGNVTTPLTPVQTDGNGNTFVLTNSSGDFNITGDYQCNTSTDQLYILVAGGNPGLPGSPTPNNKALALMAALGPCGGTLSLDPATFVNVNEVTTVAAVYALSQFMLDATHIGTSSSNSSGLANAFATAKNLASTSTGSANTSFDQIALGVTKTVTAPHDEIDYLANALVPCINSKDTTTPTDAQSGDCSSLYAASGDIPANSNFPAGSTPTDTVQAMLAIARAPLANEHAVWQLSAGIGNPPFDTGSYTEPHDWSLVLTYTGGNNDGSNAVLDANGALWSVSVDTFGNYFVTGLSNNGTPLNGPTGLYPSVVYPFTAGITGIDGIAIDTNNDLWLDESDNQGDAMSDVKQIDPSDGAVLQTVSGAGTGLDQTNSDPATIVVDGYNNIWMWMVADAPFLSTNGSVDMLKYADGYTAPPGEFPSTNGGFDNDYIFLLDGGPNLFAAGQINPGMAGIAGDGSGISGAPFVTSLLITSMAFDEGSNICILAADPVAGSDVYRIADGSWTVSPALGDSSEPVVPQTVNSLLVDGNNNVWLTLSNGQSTQLTELDSSNNTIEAIGTTTNASPTALALTTNDDSSGNLWLASQDMNTQVFTIYEYIGLAGPVQTPVSKQLLLGSIARFP